jgi:lipid A 4'-phosphatase
MNKEMLLDLLIPLLILVSLTMVFWFTNADIELQKFFYLPEKGWYLAEKNPWIFFCHYGRIPGIILLASAILIFISSLLSPETLPYRKIALFLIVYMALGPGLIVNAIFKPYWGRPRPTQIVNFGGHQQYLPPFKIGTSQDCRSFPSGHASMGFFLFSPFFFLRRNGRKWAMFFLFVGISYGVLMGFCRMVQGGHFASDILWSWGFMYLTGLMLHYLFGFDKETWWKDNMH